MSSSETKTKLDARDTKRGKELDMPRYSLAELLAKFDPDEHRHDENDFDFGADVGSERVR
jgi:hypothetical protein|tara:strand:- start:2746 stop:2925 length:180 start_codon:yes stop_codon:yes gene_type:complete